MKTEAIERALHSLMRDGCNISMEHRSQVDEARAELTAIRQEVEALELTVEYSSSDILAGTELVKLRNEEIARKDMALDDARLSLGQSFDSMEKRDLLAIIGEAERIIEAALSAEPGEE